MLTVTDLPANKIGYFLSSATQSPIPAFVDEGALCIGPFYRWNAWAQNSGTGTVVQGDGSPAGFSFVAASSGFSGPGQIMAGRTFAFQFWYRDTNSAGSTSNFSNGLLVEFVP